MKALIFAAGLGTRLKPLTDTMPKALVPIHGTPLLELVLRKLIANGFDEIIINVHHFANMVEEEVRRLLAAYQQYQAQAEGIMHQLSLTQMTAEGLERAQGAVDALDTAEVGQDLLVPIGSGSFIHGKLASKEKVVLNVGAGVSIEKTPAETREILKIRKAEVLEGSKKLNEVRNITQSLFRMLDELAHHSESLTTAG